MLCMEFSDALFQIGPLKVPGPDGFPRRFFQRNWSMVKEDIIRGVRNFFQTGKMPKGINDSNCIDSQSGETRDFKRLQANISMQRSIQNSIRMYG
jgi:hypothetical protein